VCSINLLTYFLTFSLLDVQVRAQLQNLSTLFMIITFLVLFPEKAVPKGIIWKPNGWIRIFYRLDAFSVAHPMLSEH